MERGARAVLSSRQPIETVPAMAAMFGALRETLQKTIGSAGPQPSEMPLTTVESCRAEMGTSFADVVVRCETFRRATGYCWRNASGSESVISNS
jgi:hypothetical protein